MIKTILLMVLFLGAISCQESPNTALNEGETSNTDSFENLDSTFNRDTLLFEPEETVSLPEPFKELEIPHGTIPQRDKEEQTNNESVETLTDNSTNNETIVATDNETTDSKQSTNVETADSATIDTAETDSQTDTTDLENCNCFCHSHYHCHGEDYNHEHSSCQENKNTLCYDECHRHEHCHLCCEICF
jgi:hypothetical protein